jgi:hypothetical protein
MSSQTQFWNLALLIVSLHWNDDGQLLKKGLLTTASSTVLSHGVLCSLLDI